jgi:hypothetical protein
MSKELELLNEVEKSFLYGTAGQYKEQLKTEYIEPIKQALTELEELRKVPTADEVCAKLSEHYNNGLPQRFHKNIIYHNTNKTFYFKEGNFIIYYKAGNIYFNSLYRFSPHLITMIGRFYEKESERE